MRKVADINAARVMEDLLAVGLRDKYTEEYISKNKRNLFEALNDLCMLLLNSRLEGDDENTAILENAVNALEETVESL